MELQQLIATLTAPEIIGSPNHDIHAVVLDSRKAGANSLFVALKGSGTDGHLFIPKAIENGCKAIVVEDLPAEIQSDVSYICVNDTHEALGLLASAFYQHPSEKVKLVAVTGTNGKTTVSTLLYELFTRLGYACGLVSTVENRIKGEVIPATHTTPDAVSLNALLHQMVEVGCTHVFMEASSHAIHQRRIAGLHFEGVLFTNLTHDHLDYHGTFANYRDAKKLLFDKVNADAWALTNLDDKNGPIMLQNTKAARYTYALQVPADFKARLMECDFNGLLLDIDDKQIWFRLVGRFNASNLLAVYGAAFLMGVDSETILTTLSAIGPVSGRFEYLRSDDRITGIVDYAHTPDALLNVLETINQIRSHNEQLITLIGCGGDRDAAKRPVMAETAANHSDRVILTSDNPRTENPEAILDEMQAGIPPLHYKKMLRISDRHQAIRTAVQLAKPGDIILLAGKGHETYQEINGVKHPFDDRAELRQAFNERNT